MAVPISGCQDIASAGVYTLTNNVSNANTCFYINTSDVILDCQGYVIEGSLGSNTFGILAEGSSSNDLTNISIINCTVLSWESGIKFNYVNNSSILDSTSYSNDNHNILILNSHYNNLTSINASYSIGSISEGTGLRIEGGSYNIVTDGVFSWNGDGNDYGVYIHDSFGNVLTDITANNNDFVGVHLDNGTYNNLSNILVKGNTDTGVWFVVSSYNNLANITVWNNPYGVYLGEQTLGPSVGNILINVNSSFTTTNDGLSIDFSYDNIVIDGEFSSNADSGIYLYGLSYNNTITNNSISYNTNYGIYIHKATSQHPYSNKLYNNLFNNSDNYLFTDNTPEGNYWNTSKNCSAGPNIIGGSCLGGNYWSQPNAKGHSDKCSDSDGNGICDSPLNLATNNYDYLPLAPDDNLLPNVTLNLPFHGSIVGTKSVTFNCSAMDNRALLNITLWGNFSGGGSWSANGTVNLSGTGNSTTFSKTLINGTYEWNCIACDTYHNCNWSASNYTFTVNTTVTTIVLDSPVNRTTISSGSNIDFTFNVTGTAAISNCTLVLDGVYNESNLSAITKSGSNNISVALPKGIYSWGLNCSESAGSETSSYIREIVVYDGIKPIMTKYTGTNTNYGIIDYNNVSSFWLENSTAGKIEWLNYVNISGQDLDANIEIRYNLAGVDAANLNSTLNDTTNLTLISLPYKSSPLIYRDGAICSGCTILSYGSGTLVFQVTGFSNYTTGSNSNMTIWDETDPGMPFGGKTKNAGDQVYFFANLTNTTSGESINGTGVYCNISFNATPVGPFNMTFNASQAFYQYNRNFTSSGFYSWSVMCNGTSLFYDVLNVSDTVQISGATTINSCGVLGQANTSYIQIADITADSDPCINITAANVTFDGNGYSISNKSMAGTGIYTNQFNTTIKNCNVTMNDSSGGIGIELYYSNYTSITNNTLNGQYYGLYTYNSDDATVENNTALSNYRGIYIRAGSKNTLRNNNMSGNTYNFEVWSVSNSDYDHVINPSNIVDYSYKIYYNYSISDYIYDPSTAINAGTVVCALCDNVTYKDLDLDHHNIQGALLYNTTNSKIENVTADNNYFGITLFASSGNIIKDCSANFNGNDGIFLQASTSNNITGSNASSNSGDGIYIYLYSSNNILTNNTFYSNSDEGLQIHWYSTNNRVINNTFNSNLGNGIEMLANADNNSITDNVINNNTDNGIYLWSSSDDNTLIGNTINLNDVGIEFSTSDNNTIGNNTLYSNAGLAIRFTKSNNNTIINNDIWNCSLISSSGCIYCGSSKYNVFDGNRINMSGYNGITIYSSGSGAGNFSEHNVFKNTNMTNIDRTGVVITDGSGSSNRNNTFLNFTYSNETVGANSTLIRKWHYRAYVNDSTGADVPNAAVNAYNITGGLIESLTTASDGWTPLGSLVEYINSSGTNHYYSNYTVYANKSAYVNDSKTHNVSAELNIITDCFQLTGGGPPNITLIAPANRTSHNSSYNMNFVFNVTSSSIVSGCALILNGTVNQTNQTLITINATNSINASLSRGIYQWWINCTYDITLEAYSSKWEMTIHDGLPPTLTKFNGTDVSYGITDFNNISGFWLENATAGRIEWLGYVNISGQDFDSYINVTHNLISVDSQSLNSNLNSSSNLTFFNLTYAFVPVIYRDGSPCLVCSGISYVPFSGTLSFLANGFTGYSTGSNSNLTIWDETDMGMPYGSKTKYVGDDVYFYANYTNSTSGQLINGTGINCSISFNVTPYGPFNMSLNISASLYQYNRSFGSPGIFSWNVTCNGSLLGYEVLNTTDTVNISSPVNIPPNDPSPLINSTDGSNMTSQDLNCFSTISDPDLDSVNVTVRWYRDLALNMTQYYNSSYSSGTFFNAVLESGNTSAGENWSCGMMLFDGQNYSNSTNSSILHILSAPGGITSCQPLSNPGIYLLQNNITDWSTNDCFVVTVSDVELDCQGHVVDGNGSDYGVYSKGSLGAELYNVSLRNCSFRDWNTDIYYGWTNKGLISDIEGTEGSTIWARIRFTKSKQNNITNVRLGNGSYGIWFITNSDNNIVNNSRIENISYNGIHVSSSNDNTFSYVNVSSAKRGIYLQDSDGNNITNSLIEKSNEYGIHLRQSDNNFIKNSLVKNNTGNNNIGIFLESSNHNNLTGVNVSYTEIGTQLFNSSWTNITSCRIVNNSNYGISLYNSSNNSIYNNLFNNTANFFFNGTVYENFWNTTYNCSPGPNIIGGPCMGGNYWAQPDGFGHSQNCLDGDGDGICSTPNPLAAGNTDYFPLTPPSNQSGCMNITSPGVLILNSSLNTTGTCFNISSSHVMIDCQGHSIVGPWGATGSYGITTSGDALTNITVNGCNISNFEYGVSFANVTLSAISNTIALNNSAVGIQLSYTSLSNISHVVAVGNTEGIRMENVSYSNLTNLTAAFNIWHGIQLRDGSSFNNLTDIKAFSNGGEGIRIMWGSSNNDLAYIVADSNAWGGVMLSDCLNNDLDYLFSNNNSPGVDMSNCNNSKITYFDMSNSTSDGLRVSDCSGNVFSEGMISNSSNNGIDLTRSFNNTFSNISVVNSTQSGVYLLESGGSGPFFDTNLFYDNHFSNDRNFEIASVNYYNDWNTTLDCSAGPNIMGGPCMGGNIWEYPNGTGGFSEQCVDGNGDGICNSPLTLDSSNIDYLPLTFPSNVTYCMNIASPGVYYLNNSVNSFSTCFNISSSHVTFDCQGYSVGGSLSPFTYGIVAMGLSSNPLTNITVVNCDIGSWHSGIQFYYVDFSSISNTRSFNNTEHGIRLRYSSNNTVTGIDSYEQSNGIQISDSSYDNKLNDITAWNNTYGIYVYTGCDRNTLTNINATRSNIGININGNNNSNITNSTVSNNYIGITLWDSHRGLISNNTISDNTNSGLFLMGNAGAFGPNKIFNNFFNNTKNAGLSGMTDANNWNTTLDCIGSGRNIIGGPCIGGNYWGHPNGTGFSDNCSSQTNGICDYNYTMNSMNIDFLPIVLSWSSAEWDYWNLTNYTTGAPLGNGVELTRNQRLNASAHWVLAENITQAIVRHNGAGAFKDYAIPGPYFNNWTNYTLDLSNATEFTTGGNITVDYILAQVGFNSNQTSPSMWFLLWGNASVSSAALDYDVILNGTSNAIRCNVSDSHSSVGLGGYNVSFYRNDTFLGSNVTDTTGWAAHSFSDNTDGEADYIMKCNITDQSGLYYNASGQNELTANLSVIEMGLESSVSDSVPDFGDLVAITANITTDTQNSVDSAWAIINYSNHSANVSETVQLTFSSFSDIGGYRYSNFTNSSWYPPRSGNYDVKIMANLSLDGRLVSDSTSFEMGFGEVLVYFTHQNYRILVNQSFNYTVNITAINGDLVDLNATLNSTDISIINVTGTLPPKNVAYLLNGSTKFFGWDIETLSDGITRLAIETVDGNGTNSTSLMSHEVILPLIFPSPANSSVDTNVVFNVYVGGNVSDVGVVSIGFKREYAGYTEDVVLTSNGSANESYCFGPAGSGNVASLSQGSYADCTEGDCNQSINGDNSDYWSGVGGSGEQWLEIKLNQTSTINIMKFLWSRAGGAFGNPNISVHYRESDTDPWIQVLGNLSAPNATKAWENNSGFTPFKAKSIKINFSESGWIKIYEFQALTPSGVEGLCYLYTKSFQNTNMSGNHTMTGNVLTSAGNASAESNLFLEYGTLMVQASSRTLLNGTTTTHTMAIVRVLGGDARNVSVNMSFGNSSLVIINTSNPQTYDFLRCYNCNYSIGFTIQQIDHTLEAKNIGATTSIIDANSTTGRGLNGTGSNSLQVILSDPYPPEISRFHYQYGCSGEQSPLSRANLFYDACAWIEIVENLTGVKETNVTVTFPDNATFTGLNMTKYNESGNMSWWTMGFPGVKPLNITGEYNISFFAIDYGGKNTTSNTTKNFNNTLNVTDVYYVNFTNNHSVFNRGENLAFEAIDVNNYSVASLNWTINVTINGTQNITNSTLNPYAYAVGPDKEGAISIELNVSGNNNTGYTRWDFTASRALLPVFVQPPAGSQYSKSSGISPIPQVRIYNVRSELVSYTADVNLSCPNLDFTLGRVTDLYYNLSADCRSRSSAGAFNLYAYASDAFNNSGTGQLALATESDGTGDPGDLGGTPSSPGIGIAPVVNCSNLCTGWVDVACGLGNCTREQIYQKRDCEITAGVCPAERCVYSDLCLEKLGFDFHLSEDEAIMKQGEDFKVMVSANNTGNVKILINISSESRCSAVFLQDSLELEAGDSADLFMDMHVPLSQGIGECEVNVTFLSGVSRRTRGMKVIVIENELINDLEENENKLAELERQILDLFSSGVDVSGMQGLKAGAAQSRDNARSDIIRDDVESLQVDVRNMANFIREMEAAIPMLMIYKFLLDNSYILTGIIIVSILITYLATQVLIPSSRLGKEITALMKKEKEFIQTRVSTEKQYFKRQIDESTFNKILVKKQEEILNTRGLLTTKRNERSILITRGLSLRAMLGWLASGPKRLVRRKPRLREKKDTSRSMAKE